MNKRIQRKRSKGWTMPPNTVYVGRPSRWGNSYSVREYGPTLAVVLYRQQMLDLERAGFTLDLGELRGKDLACWCSLDQPCHADVLLELLAAQRVEV